MLAYCDKLSANPKYTHAEVGGRIGWDEDMSFGMLLLAFQAVSADGWRYGACDKLWSALSGLRYACWGGRGISGVDCGWSCLAVDCGSEYAYWTVGACRL